MQLKRAKITDFVGISSADVTFEKPVSLFVGMNNQGKSSIKDSVLFGLSGKCRALTKFKDVAHLTRGGNGSMAVELAYVDDNGTDCQVKRTKNSISVGIDNRDILRYCLNPHEFISLPPRDRGRVLADVLGGGMNDVVKAAIVEHIGSINETLLAEIKASNVDILNLDAFTTQVVASRRQYKRDLAAIPKNAPLLPDFELDQDYKAEADEESVKTLAGRMSKGGDLIAAAKKQLEIKADLVDIERAIEKLEANKRKVPRLPKDVIEDDVRMGSVYCTIIEDLLAANKGKMINCPLSAGCHPREKMEARKKELEEFLGSYQDVLNRHDEAVKHNGKIEAEMARLKEQRKKLNESLEPVDLPKGSETLLADLTIERDAKQTNLSNHSRYTEAMEKYEQGSKRREVLEGLIKEADRIDGALKDGGPVKSEIARNGRKLPINKTLLSLWGMEALEWSDNGNISLRQVLIEYCSKSEKQRAACIMGLALADISGIGVAAIDDEFDSLDEDNRNAFFGAVTECKLNNVIVCASTKKDYSEVGLPTWLEVFRVEQGRIERIQ